MEDKDKFFGTSVSQKPPKSIKDKVHFIITFILVSGFIITQTAYVAERAKLSFIYVAFILVCITLISNIDKVFKYFYKE